MTLRGLLVNPAVGDLRGTNGSGPAVVTKAAERGAPAGVPRPLRLVRETADVRLLLVTPSRSYRVGDFLDAARALRCEVVVATDGPPAVPGSSVPVSFADPGAAARLLVDRVGAVDGVVGTDGDAVAVAAATARLLGLAANSPAAVAAAGDKYRQRRAAATAGVRQPTYALVDGVDGGDGGDWATFPSVVKPRRRSASQGVVRADTAAELTAALLTVRAIVGADEALLVEEFVPGVEVAVDGLLQDGRLDVLAVFDKPDTPSGPTFPETLLVSPTRLDPAVLDRVVDVVGRAVAAIGLMEGPVHVECKVDGSDVWFLELGARTIGGLCGRALRHGDVSLEELVVRHALRLALPTLPPDGASGVLMLPVGRSGRLEAVGGVDAARGVPGVTDVVITVGPGEHVVALPAGDRYLGFVFARARSPDRVEAALRTAWAALELDITVS